MNELYKEQLEVLVKQNAEQAEQIELLKELLSLCQPDVSNVMDTRIREALAAPPQGGE